MKKVLALTMAVALAAGMLAGCGGTADTGAADTGTASSSIWGWGSSVVIC